MSGAPTRMGKRDAGGSLRRFATPKPKGARINLPSSHPASRDAHSLFPSRVFHASVLPRLLKSGENASKIGKVITKGKWRGFPVYTLTLEERATCPRSCQQWATCYGNNMHMAERIIGDEIFENRLWDELATLNDKHPAGFVVRLHILGDFYDQLYVDLWEGALDAFPALHVFGYTAHTHGSEMGDRLLSLATTRWARFAVRLSGFDELNFGAVVVDRDEGTDHIICPAQSGGTECCATCGLCWQSVRTIAFLRH